MKKILIIFISIVIQLLFVSCKSHYQSVLSFEYKDRYYLSYNDATIAITSDNHDKDTTFLYCKNGEYYENEYDNLFLSTKKDTVYEFSIRSRRLRREIYPVRRTNLYKSDTYWVGDNQNRDIIIVSYTFDENYKIVKISKELYVEYK